MDIIVRANFTDRNIPWYFISPPMAQWRPLSYIEQHLSSPREIPRVHDTVDPAKAAEPPEKIR